jgi:phosphatidylinositol-3-phosphatase
MFTCQSIRHVCFLIVFAGSLMLVSLSASAQVPRSQHVVLVIEENHNFSEVQSNMPWLISQGNANGYATNYFAENGGSLKDYLWLASGSCHNASACTLPAGTHDFGCTGNSCSSPITDDNIFRELNNAGIAWKVYAQSYAAAGGTVTTPDQNNGTSYYRRHNGVTWYSDILSNVAPDGTYPKLVDFSQFAIDLANNALPPFVIIVPDGAHDAHDSCSTTNCLLNADNFLKDNVGPMLAKSYFQPGGDGMLLVTFDECGAGVNTCTPGNVYTAIIGPKVIPNTVSGIYYQHENALRTMLEALGITTYPGGAATHTAMSDFFNPGSTALLADDFSTTSIDPTKWSNTLFTGTQNTSVPVSDTNGQLQIGPLPTNATSSSYNGITSLNRYDFTGAAAYVQLVQPAASNSNAFTMFAVGNDINNFYRFYVSAGSLVCEKKIGGTKSQLGSVAYDSIAHQFLRIRHDPATGSVVYETAANNSGVPGTWTQQCSDLWNTTAIPVTSVLFEMKAGTSVAEVNPPGTIIFDNFKAQKVALLADNFNSTSVDTAKWSNTLFTGAQNTSVPVSDTSGELQIGPLPTTATSSSYNGITSLKRYNLTGAFAYVQLVQPAASNSNAFTMFAVGNDGSNFYRFYVSAGSLVCEKKIGGTKTQLGSVVYNSVSHQFLRIRHDASTGNVVYETAPNSSGVPGAWTQQCSELWNTTAIPVTSVLFEMKAGTSVAEPNPPGTVIFDNFLASQ